MQIVLLNNCYNCFQGKKKVENWEKMTSKQRLMKALESVSINRSKLLLLRNTEPSLQCNFKLCRHEER